MPVELADIITQGLSQQAPLIMHKFHLESIVFGVIDQRTKMIQHCLCFGCHLVCPNNPNGVWTLIPPPVMESHRASRLRPCQSGAWTPLRKAI